MAANQPNSRQTTRGAVLAATKPVAECGEYTLRAIHSPVADWRLRASPELCQM